jgi:hypothetical protein
MKATLPILMIALALCAGSATHLRAMPDEFNHPMMFNVATVTNGVGELVTTGLSEGAVNIVLGTPRQKISDTVWAYQCFRGDSEDCANHRCDVLLVVFENRLVRHLAMANEKAVKRLCSRSDKNADYVCKFLNASEIRYLPAE